MSFGVQWNLSPFTWPACVAGVGAVGVVLYLARRQPARTPRWARRALPTLRLAALAGLIIAMFQPVLHWTDELTRGRVVAVLLDASRSMATRDEPETPGEPVRVADGLGLLATPRANDATPVDLALRGVREHARALRDTSNEIDYARLANRPTDEPRSRLEALFVGLSRELFDIAGLCQDHDATRVHAGPLRELSAFCAGPSPDVSETQRRIEDQLAAVGRTIDTLDAAAATNDPAVAAVTARLKDLSRFDLARLATRADLSGVMANLSKSAAVRSFVFAGETVAAPDHDPLEGRSPDGNATDLAAALDRVIGNVPAGRLDAVVVFSDGRTQRPVSAAPALAAGVPMYPVRLGPARPRRDARVLRLEAPATALVGETVIARVDVQTAGLPAGPVTVRLTADDVTQTQTITTNGNETRPVEFPVRVARIGELKLNAALDPVPNEAARENNAALRVVRAVSGKLRVVVLWGAAGWDVQYLRNALSRVAWVELTEQHLPPGAACSLPPEQVLKSDLVVLCDVAPAALSARQVEALHTLVQDRAGGVLVLAGASDVLSRYAADPLLAALLPYRSDGDPSWRIWPGEQAAFVAVPARDAPPAEWLTLDAAPDASARRWLARPAFFRVLGLPQLKPNARPLLVDRDSRLPLVIETASGGGRAVMVAVDETWRWRKSIGGPAHDRFWLALARYCVDPPYAANAGPLALDTDRTQYLPGEPVHLRARVAVTSTDRRPDAAIANVAISTNGKTIETREVKELIPGGRRFESTFADLRPGNYELKFSAGSDGQAVTLPLVVTESADRELLDISTDPQQLERLASATGGQVITPETLATLPVLIEQQRRGRTARAEYAVWCSPYVFLFVLGCLGCEWALRKRAGMV